MKSFCYARKTKESERDNEEENFHSCFTRVLFAKLYSLTWHFADDDDENTSTSSSLQFSFFSHF